MARRSNKAKGSSSGFAEQRQVQFGDDRQADRQFVELGAGGRVVIPAAFRAALGMKPGDRLMVRLEGNELRVYTQREGIRRARELVRKHVPGGLGTVEEFLAERRAEAAREMEKFEDE